MGKLSSIYSKGEFAPVASTGQYLDLEGKPDIAAIAPNRWTTTGVKTANYTATTAENVPCNSTGGPFNVTLPAVGSRVRVFDAVGVSGAGGFAANSVTVLPSAGTTVMGDISFELDLGGAAFEFELIGTDWRVSAGIVPIQEPHFGGDYSELTNAPSLGDLIAETSPLVLPNNSRINGVEHFYQTTKPTVRGDGSALVVGDRWWKTDTGEEWFWNGTYWLSLQEYKHICIGTTGALAYGAYWGYWNKPNTTSIFIINQWSNFVTVGASPDTVSCSLRFYDETANTLLLLPIIVTNVISGTVAYSNQGVVNTAFDITEVRASFFHISKVGSSTNPWFSAGFNYREIA